MSDQEQNQRPHRVSHKDAVSAVRRARLGPEAPAQPEPESQATAQEVPESRPEPQRTPQQTPTPQGQERAEEPATLTGEETPEQLKEMGWEINRPATYDRFKNLARERNEAAARVEQLEARLKELEARAGSEDYSASNEAPAPKPRNPLPEDDAWKFDVPEPDPDDDPEAHLEWRIEKRLHEKMVAGDRKVAEAAASLVAPIQQQAAKAHFDREWQSNQDALDMLGASREELEPATLAMLTSSPKMGFRAAIWAAADAKGILGDGFSPEVPDVQVPGSGRKTPAGSQPAQRELTLDEQRAAAHQAMRNAYQEGASETQLRQARADFIGRHVRRRMPQ